MKLIVYSHHTCIDFSYNLDIHIMINNMSIVIPIHLEIVEKQNATILNAMCIYQFRYDFYNYFFSSRKIIESQLNKVPIFFGPLCTHCLSLVPRRVSSDGGMVMWDMYNLILYYTQFRNTVH